MRNEPKPMPALGSMKRLTGIYQRWCIILMEHGISTSVSIPSVLASKVKAQLLISGKTQREIFSSKLNGNVLPTREEVMKW
jgi:hypothetical protein